MNFPNPFKKKEEDFTLNETELPSLSDSMPQSFDDNSNYSGLDLPDLPSSPSMPSLDENVQPLSGLSSQTSSFGATQPENPFATSSPSVPEQPVQQNQTGTNQDLHNEISRVKLETIDSKMILMDARLSAIEQKLELVFQMISSEVSEDTKRKLKVDSMMNRIK